MWSRPTGARSPPAVVPHRSARPLDESPARPVGGACDGFLFASKKYDAITYPIEQFCEDAKDGTLANVMFVDPDYTAHAEFNGTSNDYHPYGSVQVAEDFVARSTTRSRRARSGTAWSSC